MKCEDVRCSVIRWRGAEGDDRKEYPVTEEELNKTSH